MSKREPAVEKAMHELLERLTGGDRRSIGRSNEVVTAVLRDPSLFGVLFGGLSSSDPLIRMRAADALEKIAVRHPEWLHPYKEQLIRQVAQSQEHERQKTLVTDQLLDRGGH